MQALALAGQDLNHATNRIRAIHRTGWTTQHLHTLNSLQGHGLPRSTTRAALHIHPNPVDIHRRKFIAGTTQVHASGRARATVTHHLNPWQTREHILQGCGTTQIQRLTIHNRDICQRIRQRL